MLKELKRGDHVLTNGGIYATITEVGEQNDDTIMLEIAKGITVKASATAVASITEEKVGD